MKTTQENNRLIKGGRLMNSFMREGKKFIPITEGLAVKSYRDWNSLMPVVEKIESLGFTSAIKTRYVRINPKENASYYNYISWVSYNENGWYVNQPYPTTDSEPDFSPKERGDETLTKLEATYKAVVQFIEWWNEQNAAEKNS